MNYEGLSRVADDFQAKAKGNNPDLEGLSDEPNYGGQMVSDRRAAEVGLEAFNKVDECWSEFCNDVLGEGGPVNMPSQVWLDKGFNTKWNEFVKEVSLMNDIIQSRGSQEAYDTYYGHLDEYYNS